MKHGVYEKRQKEISEKQLKLLEKGFDFGKKLYNSREDFYESERWVFLIDTNILVYAHGLRL